MFNVYDFIFAVLCGAGIGLVIIGIDVTYRIYLYNKRIEKQVKRKE